MPRGQFRLKKRDRKYLKGLVIRGTIEAREFKRAQGLLSLDEGQSQEDIAKSLGVVRATVAAWRDSYKEVGLKFLKDAPRRGRPTTLDGMQRAKITALACSEAPEGYGQWSLRLLADKVVELGYCEKTSYSQVRRVLKKTTSSRTLKRRGALGR